MLTISEFLLQQGIPNDVFAKTALETRC